VCNTPRYTLHFIVIFVQATFESNFEMIPSAFGTLIHEHVEKEKEKCCDGRVLKTIVLFTGAIKTHTEACELLLVLSLGTVCVCACACVCVCVCLFRLWIIC